MGRTWILTIKRCRIINSPNGDAPFWANLIMENDENLEKGRKK